MKETAYKGLVRQVLEYRSSVWEPHTHGFQEKMEKEVPGHLMIHNTQNIWPKVMF